MSSERLPPANLPNLGSTKSQILRQLVAWEEEYEARKSEAGSHQYVTPTTTNKLAKHFNINQRKMLDLLNHLELLGFITKHRRQSAGPSGNGYDGSLYSEVHPTARARILIARISPSK